MDSTESGRRLLAPEPRILALDGLRGLAIAAVLVMHLYIRLPTPPGDGIHSVLKRCFSLAYTGVDLFFVLSGFLIGGILLARRRSPNLIKVFYVRRFFRIVPLYSLLLLSFFLVPESAELNALNGGHLFAGTVPFPLYVLFLQNFGMSWSNALGAYWLIVTWSLAIEEQFYLIVPWIVRAVSSGTVLAIAIVFACVAPAARLLILQFCENSGLAAAYLLPCRADALLMGVIVAWAMGSESARRLLKSNRPLLRSLSTGLAVLFVALSAGNYDFISWVMTPFGYSIVALFYAVILLRVLVDESPLLNRTLTYPPLRKLGRISYFVYLFHQPVTYLLHGYLRHQPPQLTVAPDYLVTLLAAVLVIVLGLLSLRWIEGPLLAIGHRYAFSHPASGEAV